MDFNKGKDGCECKKWEVSSNQRSLYHIPEGSNTNTLLWTLYLKQQHARMPNLFLRNEDSNYTQCRK